MPLVALTKHPDGFVRQDAATALGALGDPRAAEALVALLTDHTKPERRSPTSIVTTIHTVASKAREALWRLKKPQD
jgi:HEAT repeat protein